MCLPAHQLYPLRVRVLNVDTDEAVWVTVAYIPIVRKMKEPGAANRARKRRCGLLQRVLFLAFRTAVASSNVGTNVQWGRRQLKLFARILLYICDLPEEKAVLCLKGGKCAFPCSMCDVSVHDAGAVKALKSNDRDALILVRRQLEGAGHRACQRESRRRLHLESTSSAHSEVPMMAAMGGLASRPFLMYKMVGFDALHVSLLALRVQDTYTLVEQPHAWVAPMFLSQLTHLRLDCSFFPRCSGRMLRTLMPFHSCRCLTWGSRACCHIASSACIRTCVP